MKYQEWKLLAIIIARGIGDFISDVLFWIYQPFTPSSRFGHFVDFLPSWCRWPFDRFMRFASNSCLMYSLARQPPLPDEVIIKLIGKGVDTNIRNEAGQTPLSVALTHRKYTSELVIFKLLPSPAVGEPATKHAVNDCDELGNTYLMTLLSRHPAVSDVLVQKLLDLGTDINIQNAAGETALLMAARRSRRLSTVKLLLQAGAVTSLEDRRGKTPLYYSIVKGDRPAGLFDALLEHHPEISVVELLAAVCFASKGTKTRSLVTRLISSGKAVPHFFDKYILKKIIPPYDFVNVILNSSRDISQAYTFSPLFLAFLYRDLNMARYFIAVNFLNSYDVNTPKSHVDLLFKVLKIANGTSDSMSDMASSFYQQPKSLLALSAVKVSMCVGGGEGRRARLTDTGIPSHLQKALMFEM